MGFYSKFFDYRPLKMSILKPQKIRDLSPLFYSNMVCQLMLFHGFLTALKILLDSVWQTLDLMSIWPILEVTDIQSVTYPLNQRILNFGNGAGKKLPSMMYQERLDLNCVSIQILMLNSQRKKAIIDAVLECSGQRNVYYIGHSQGTLVMFAHLSECYPEEARKIRCFFALGTC